MALTRVWPLVAVLMVTSSQAQILNWFGWGAKPTTPSATIPSTHPAVLTTSEAALLPDTSAFEEKSLPETATATDQKSFFTDTNEKVPSTLLPDLTTASSSSQPAAPASSPAVSKPPQSNETFTQEAATPHPRTLTTLTEPSTKPSPASLKNQQQTTESPLEKPPENALFRIFQVEINEGSDVETTTPASKDEPTSVPEASTPQNLDKENIAGVGAEILNVAENIRNIMSVWVEKPENDLQASTNSTPDQQEMTNVTVHLNETSILSVPGSGQNDDNITETQTYSLLSSSSNLTFNISARNLTSPGISPFPVYAAAESWATPSPNKSSSGTSQMGDQNRESLPGTELDGSSLHIAPLDSQAMHTGHAGSMRTVVPMNITSSLASGLSHDVINSTESMLHKKSNVHNDSADFNQSDERIGLHTHSGIAATADQIHAPNTHVVYSEGHPSASTSDHDLLTSTKASTATAFRNNRAETAFHSSKLTPSDAHCLPVPNNLPFCRKLGIETFMLPNYLNHTSVLEIQAALHDWEGLLKSRCHRYLEWFFCLLLVPRCNPSSSLVSPPVPCRGFCKVLEDACWDLLKGAHLPVSCDALPEKDSGVPCVYIHFSTGSEAVEGSFSSEWSGK